jgi:hypothetical protein
MPFADYSKHWKALVPNKFDADAVQHPHSLAEIGEPPR